MNLPQTQLLERLRSICQQDERVAAALLYGSFTTEEADAYSDIECVMFFTAESLPSLDKQAWLRQIAPVHLFFADDFGHYTAIFEGLIRGEFHFDSVADMSKIATWHGSAWFPSLDSTMIVDRTGLLADALQPLIGAPPERDTSEAVERLTVNFANIVLFGLNVLERGELVRTLDILAIAHRQLLWMARLTEGSIQHWPTPSRALEGDISAEAYARFKRCTASLDKSELADAYQQTWRWGAAMATALNVRHGLVVPQPLFDLLSQRLDRVFG